VLNATHTIRSRLSAGVSLRSAAAGLLLVTALIAGLFGLDHLLRPGTFPVRRVSFEGEFKHVDQQQLSSALVPLVSGNFYLLDLDEIKHRAEGVPWVHRVAVRRNWPDGVHVRFTEQVLAARWGTRAWVNSSGELVDLRGQDGIDGLPLFEGPDGTQNELLEHYTSLNGILSAAGLRIASLRLTPRRTWQIELDNNIALVLGREAPEEKVARFARLYPGALAAQAARIRQVDLRYTNGFAVQWLSANTGSAAPRLGRS
jgi:cell division protein FtsQ